MAQNAIATPLEFFTHVVAEDVDELTRNSTDLRCAYHACTSLLSLRDWIVQTYANSTWSYAQAPMATFGGVGKLQAALESIDARFAYTTDIANASKHMVLDPRKNPRSLLWGNANTRVQTVGGASDRIVVDIGGTNHDVLACVTAVYAVWQRLMSENNW